MTKWHAHVAHMTEHMNMVGGTGPGPGPLLCEEVEALKKSAEIRKPVKLFEFLARNNRYPFFHNLFIALRMYITIPVTLASGKRSYSMLRLIKTYLRSSIQQERLNSLKIMSIESKISRGLNMDKILKHFVDVEARKISFC